MSRKKPVHRTTVAKRNLFGVRMWWATCSCGTWFQGCHLRQDAQWMAAEHVVRQSRDVIT